MSRSKLPTKSRGVTRPKLAPARMSAAGDKAAARNKEFRDQSDGDYVRISLEGRGLKEALKTVVAFLNTEGGTLAVMEPDAASLANFIRGLEEEIFPSARAWHIAQPPFPNERTILFKFGRAGGLCKLRCVGKFVRHGGENRRLTVPEQNALLRKREMREFGQASLFESAAGGGEAPPSSRLIPFSSPLNIAQLQPQIASLLEQRKRTRDVFISYSHADYSFANLLKRGLEYLGLSVWIDERALQPGDELPNELGRGIGKCKVGVVIVSRASTQSRWVRGEVSVMLFHRRFHDRRFAIVPALIDDSTIFEELADVLYADMREGTGGDIARLAARVRQLVMLRESNDSDQERP